MKKEAGDEQKKYTKYQKRLLRVNVLWDKDGERYSDKNLPSGGF